MTDHLHPDTLALFALDEPVEPEERAHLEHCETCRAEWAELQRVRDVAVALSDDDREPPPPPPRVWDAIAREIHGQAAGPTPGAPPPGTPPPPPGRGFETPGAGEAVTPSEDRTLTPDEGPTTVPEGGDASPGAVTSLAEARARRGRIAAALAVAASLVVVVVVGAVVLRPAAPTLVADTELEALAAVSPGTARLVAIDGTLHLEVQAPELPPPDGYYALWLIDRDVTGMISLGPLEPDRAYPLPEGFDPADFPVVDVSIEPFDGDPTHSGNSVLRGVLPVQS